MIISIDKLENVEKLLEKLGLSYKLFFVTNEEFIRKICIEDLIEEQVKEKIDIYVVVIVDNKNILDPFSKYLIRDLIRERERKVKNSLTTLW